MKQRAKEWYANHNADKREATPPWADMKIIRRFHAEAKRISKATGILHSVDHIVPIQGDDVRGLHVHTNLRIITASANSAKNNKFIPELLEFFDALVIW